MLHERLPEMQIVVPKLQFLDHPVYVGETEKVIIVGSKWPDATSATTVMDKEGKWIIDPGSLEGLPWILHNIEQAGIDRRSIEDIFITHTHIDHIESAAILRDLLEKEGRHPKLHVYKGATDILARGDIYETAADVYNKRLNTIRSDDEIEAGNFTRDTYEITVIPSPGHSIAHASYLIGDILVPGDAYGDLTKAANLEVMLESFQRILEYPFEYVIESHTDAAEVAFITRNEFIKIVNSFAITDGDLKPGYKSMRTGRG